MNGWAMEARLYAEDPAKGFLPSIGRLDAFDLGKAVRVDTGVVQGAEITSFYDPMIAKVIAHGETREKARDALVDALDGAVVWPLHTNAGFLVKTLDHPVFVAAKLDTGLIAREGDVLMPPALPRDETLVQAAAALARPGPIAGFRLNAAPCLASWLSVGGERVAVDFDGAEAVGTEALDSLLIMEGGQTWEVMPWRASGTIAGGAADGAILSPMPGRVIAVDVAAGDRVASGQKLVTLEAMKMEHSLLAPFNGVVAELSAQAGGQVAEGTMLIRVEREEDA